MSDSIELVVFDLGRVLIRICDDWRHACDVAGLPRPGEIDAARQAKLLEYVHGYEIGGIDLPRFASSCAPLLEMPDEHVVALSNAYLLGPYPGAVQLIDELNAAGYSTACLSNTNANHWRLMNERGGANDLMLENFTHLFASHLVRMGKPEERIYAHVEQVAGVAPRKIVFFDDLEENMMAARRRGWHGHRIAIDADPIAQVRSHLRAHRVAVAP